MAELRQNAPRTRVFKKERNYTNVINRALLGALLQVQISALRNTTPPPILCLRGRVQGACRRRLRRRPLVTPAKKTAINKPSAQNLSMALPWFYLLATGSAYWQLTRVRPHYARGCASRVFVFFLDFFRATVASGLVTCNCELSPRRCRSESRGTTTRPSVQPEVPSESSVAYTIQIRRPGRCLPHNAERAAMTLLVVRETVHKARS